MAQLRIGINALFLVPGDVGGTEVYLRQLLIALSEVDVVNKYVVFVNHETDRDLVPSAPNFEMVRHPVRAAFRPARIVWEQTALVLSAALRHLDVMFNPGFTVPLACRCPLVTMFHDLQYKRHPELFRWFDLPFWKVLLPASAHRSHFVLAPSEATASDLRHFYEMEPDRIRVIPHGVDAEFFALAQARCAPQGRRYFLAVSTLHPHKNLDRLLRVFARFRVERPEFRLVIVGCKGFVTKTIEDLVTSLSLGPYVEITGWIPRGKVYEYFAGAFGLIHPSRFEGFGMPVLEALAAGLPTTCSGIEPLITIAGGSCLHFDPEDESAMLEAIRRLSADEPLRRELVMNGLKVAQSYSWRRCAEETLDALLETVNGPRKAEAVVS